MAKGKRVQAAKPAKGKTKAKGGKRSKAEDMTGAKANEVEVSPVLDIKPIEIDEGTFDVQYRSIKAALDKEETAKSITRNCKKRAKEAGEDVYDSVMLTIKLERQDPQTIQRNLQIHGYALKKANIPVQLTLHNPLLGEIKDIAYKRGFSDGEAGRTANSTYPPGSEPDKSYMRGWHHGSGKNLGQTPEQVDAAMSEQPEPMWNEDPPHLTGSEDETESPALN